MTSLKCVKKTDFKIESILFQQLNIKRRRRRQHCYNNDDDVTRTQGGELGLLKQREKITLDRPRNAAANNVGKKSSTLFRGRSKKLWNRGLRKLDEMRRDDETVGHLSFEILTRWTRSKKKEARSEKAGTGFGGRTGIGTGPSDFSRKLISPVSLRTISNSCRFCGESLLGV